MKEETRNKIAYYSIFIASLSLLISAVNIYELHFSGSKLRIESFESYKEHVSFILYNAGREPAFIKQLSIEELGLDKRPIGIIVRPEYKKGEYPFPEVTPHEDITIEPKSSIKAEGKIPYPGATITKEYRIVAYNSQFKIMVKKYFQVSW